MSALIFAPKRDAVWLKPNINEVTILCIPLQLNVLVKSLHVWKEVYTETGINFCLWQFACFSAWSFAFLENWCLSLFETVLIVVLPCSFCPFWFIRSKLTSSVSHLEVLKFLLDLIQIKMSAASSMNASNVCVRRVPWKQTLREGVPKRMQTLDLLWECVYHCTNISSQQYRITKYCT